MSCIGKEYNENKGRYDQEISQIVGQLARLEDADQNFYTTASYLLQLFKYGDKIFEVASDEEKQQIISIVLSNLSLKGKTIRFTPNEPFATVLKFAESSVWQELQNDYRTLIGVTIDKSDVNLPSKISKEEQKNV